MSEKCGCVPGQYTCGTHKRQAQAQAYKRLSEKEKAYDRMVDPVGWYHQDFPTGCSCHISAPCSFCVGEVDQE